MVCDVQGREEALVFYCDFLYYCMIFHFQYNNLVLGFVRKDRVRTEKYVVVDDKKQNRKQVF